MNYYAHTRKEGAWQPLKEHLESVASLAASFARPGFRQSARLAGLLHDIGKYQPSFQKRLNGANLSVDHAVCGAKEATKLLGCNPLGMLFAYIVAGHHAGLSNIGGKLQCESESDLRARLKKETEDYAAYKAEIDCGSCVTPAKAELSSFVLQTPQEASAAYEFAIRYLFSCLTDADFLDTERFCLGKGRAVFTPDWAQCQSELEAKLSSFVAKTALQKSRATLQEQAKQSAEQDAGVYLLDLPTGAGKTLCSMSVALKRLQKGGKKRIIYVIPYTTIIEQTAEEFEKLFPGLTILEHHSGVDFDENLQAELGCDVSESDEKAEDILKKSTENWDAPLIITTNVQFFESIYSNRSSKLRKFHNMADSIIVFDEIHTLPTDYFIPCMRAVAMLTSRFGCEALFLTATMPDFNALIGRFLGTQIKTVDLVPDKTAFALFEKCTLEEIGGDVLSRLGKDKSALLIFNKKKTAAEYYDSFEGTKYYLSTYMTPFHRSRVIAEIKEKLAAGEKITVFSTSLVEAGVDFDFECVFREIAGVDNILQAAGRCNREGKRSKADSKVYLFQTDSRQSGELERKAAITKGLLQKYGAQGLCSRDCIREYFDMLYETESWSMKGKEEGARWNEIDFVKIAEEFNLIESTTAAIVIPSEENAEEIAKARAGHANRRKLQKFCASVGVYELKELLSSGIVKDYDGVFILESPDFYSDEKGIRCETEKDYFY